MANPDPTRMPTIERLQKAIKPKAPSQQALLDACSANDEARVAGALAQGAEPSPSESNYWHAMHICAGRGYGACARLLIEAGADVDRPTASGVTAMKLAARAGHVHVLGLLIEAGALVDDGALSAAVEACETEAAKMIHALGRPGKWAAYWLSMEAAGRELASRSASGQDLEERRLLATSAWILEQAGGPPGVVGDGDSLLPRLAGLGVVDSLIALALDAGAPVDGRGEWGMAALHRARSPGALRMLLAAGADVDARDDEGRAPLHCARSAEHVEILARAGADVDARAGDGATPLLALASAAPHGDGEPDGPMDPLRALLEAGADPEARDFEGRGVGERLSQAQADRAERLECGGYDKDKDEDEDDALDLQKEFDRVMAMGSVVAAMQRRALGLDTAVAQGSDVQDSPRL